MMNCIINTTKNTNSLDTKNRKELDYKKLRFIDDYEYSPDKKEETDANVFNEWINKEETDINKELFKKHFSFQRPSSMFKDLYQTNDKEKNNKLVSMISSGF